MEEKEVSFEDDESVKTYISHFVKDMEEAGDDLAPFVLIGFVTAWSKDIAQMRRYTPEFRLRMIDFAIGHYESFRYINFMKLKKQIGKR